MVLLFVFVLVSLVVFLVLLSFFFNWSDYQKKEIVINGQEIEVEIVKGALAQSRGLSGRTDLAENQGMLFIFKTAAPRHFWMKEMKFPIDIIWIKGEQVIGFEENALPQPGAASRDLRIYSSAEPADKALEMKAGSIRRLGISPGNVIIFNI